MTRQNTSGELPSLSPMVYSATRTRTGSPPSPRGGRSREIHDPSGRAWMTGRPKEALARQTESAPVAATAA
ncbi:MAG: hypothetical protein ACM3ML_37585 [Micromonosporaceae bacterium]